MCGQKPTSLWTQIQRQNFGAVHSLCIWKATLTALLCPITEPRYAHVGHLRICTSYLYVHTSSDVHEHIGEAVEVLGNVIEILCEISDMQDDKLGAGMSCDYAVASFEQL